MVDILPKSLLVFLPCEADNNLRVPVNFIFNINLEVVKEPKAL